mgnify:CR=1 FL=1
MNINLNAEYVTKEKLLQEISDVDIYTFYTKTPVDLSGPIISPLLEDKKPSFGYFVNNKGEVCFNDFRLGGGDCIKFVQLKFGLSFFDAMSKIAIDFNIDNKFIVRQINNKTIGDISLINNIDRSNLLKTAGSLTIGKKSIDFTLKDYVYWYNFGITKTTLLKYNVEKVSYIFINGTPILADNYAYCFSEHKDYITSYKIYQPFNEKYKWLNNHNGSVWQGWSQLPEKGDLLIITKSLKDVMAINDVLGIPAVSLQAEGVKPKPHIIKELKSRFKEILIFYDNDYDKDINWGRKFASELAMEFGFHQVEIPDRYLCKDFSDLVKKIGVKEAKRIWYNFINLPY